jgi:hypothetical protein
MHAIHFSEMIVLASPGKLGRNNIGHTPGPQEMETPHLHPKS